MPSFSILSCLKNELKSPRPRLMARRRCNRKEKIILAMKPSCYEVLFHSGKSSAT